MEISSNDEIFRRFYGSPEEGERKKRLYCPYSRVPQILPIRHGARKLWGEGVLSTEALFQRRNSLSKSLFIARIMFGLGLVSATLIQCRPVDD